MGIRPQLSKKGKGKRYFFTPSPWTFRDKDNNRVQGGRFLRNCPHYAKDCPRKNPVAAMQQGGEEMVRRPPKKCVKWIP